MQVETFDTLDQAAGAMRERTQYLGGGTLVMRAVSYGDQSFDRIVRTRDAGLRQIVAQGDRIEITRNPDYWGDAPALEVADPTDVSTWPEGGMGIALMQQCMDDVTYSAGSQFNSLTLKKRCTLALPTESSRS